MVPAKQILEERRGSTRSNATWQRRPDSSALSGHSPTLFMCPTSSYFEQISSMIFLRLRRLWIFLSNRRSIRRLRIFLSNRKSSRSNCSATHILERIDASPIQLHATGVAHGCRCQRCLFWPPHVCQILRLSLTLRCWRQIQT